MCCQNSNINKTSKCKQILEKQHCGFGIITLYSDMIQIRVVKQRSIVPKHLKGTFQHLIQTLAYGT